MTRLGLALCAGMAAVVGLGDIEQVFEHPLGIATPAQAIIGRPLTPLSVGGVARRTARRTVRRTEVRLSTLPAGCVYGFYYGAYYYRCGGVYYQSAGGAYVQVIIN